MSSLLHQQIEQILSSVPIGLFPLSGGSVGEVYRVELADGRKIVAKVNSWAGANLDIEGTMLSYLAATSDLPVPTVLYNSPELLLMTFIEGKSHFGELEQEHAAELLAALHNIRAPQFGFEQDTLIGGLRQPNPFMNTWIDFFREQRLLYMAREGDSVGHLPQGFLKRLETFAEKLENWLFEPEHPALIHGDAWTTNILAKDGRITGFLDPAIYYAHPEIELAFTTLFSTFHTPFFERYSAIRPIAAGFFEERKDIYNLYPLLVHVRLFGTSYLYAIDRTLKRLGY